MTAGTPTPVSPRMHIGKWRAPEDHPLMEMRDPADTRSVVAHCPMAGPEAAAEAVAVAERGAPAWAGTSYAERGRILERAAGIMERRGDELARAITLEMGKPLAESRTEVARTAEHTRYFAMEARRPEGMAERLGSNGEMAFTLRTPLGVVAAIGPWNFPLMIPNWKVAAALVHGNAVVLKPAEISPLSATVLVECYLEAGLPADVLSLVFGRGAEVGAALIQAAGVAGVTFTGSTAVGLGIASDASRLGKRAQCEMGGKNALVVMEDADLEAAVGAIVLGGFGTSGQRCTSSSRVLVQRAVAQNLLDALVHAARKLTIGHGLAPGTDVGPMASEQHLNNALTRLEKSVADDATVVHGGRRLTDGEHAHGWFMEPTVVTAPPAGYVFEEELFGPIVSVHTIDTLDEAIELNNRVRYGLSAAIYTSDLTAAHRFVRETDTGMVHVNRPTVGAEAHLPFGGAKASALGPAELGGAVDFFTKRRTAHIRWSA